MTIPGHIRELRLQGKALLGRHRGIQEVRAEVQSPKPEAVGGMEQVINGKSDDLLETGCGKSSWG